MLMTVLSLQSHRISHSLVSCPDFSRCVRSCKVIPDNALYSVGFREANQKEIHTVTGRLEFRKFSSHKLYSDSASFLLWASEAGKFANSTSRRLKVQFRFVVFLDFAFDRESASRYRHFARVHPQEQGLTSSGNILKTRIDGSHRIRMKSKQIYLRKSFLRSALFAYNSY